MAKTDKEFYDELATIYSIANQSVPIHENENAKLQQVAACAALFAMKLAKDYELNVIDAAPYIPYWIWKIMNSGNSAFSNFQMSPLPKGVQKINRSEGRRQGGIDYTAKDVIHKVIDPLFLDELKSEFEEIMKLPPNDDKAKKLLDYQEKLASLKFLDPACGCGNFLVETYVSLRKLENEVLAELKSIAEAAIKDVKPP